MRNRSVASVRLLWPAVFALAMLGGCEWFKPKPPDIAFAPYDQGYASKPDFNQLEYKMPLSRLDRSRITPENIARLDQEQIDQIYARLTAGPIPDGPFDGKVLFPRGTSGEFRGAEIAGGFATTALQMKGLVLQDFAETIWKGKVFYRGERVLRNRIDDLTVLRKLGLVDGEPKKITVGNKDAWLLFPAKLYCGQSLLDARRESIIIDYFFTDEIPGYQEKPDYLAGRRGLRVRDEIRMVRPGFYLGRAYLDRVFALNFTLYNREIAERESDAFVKSGPFADDCWVGTQAHRSASAQ